MLLVNHQRLGIHIAVHRIHPRKVHVKDVCRRDACLLGVGACSAQQQQPNSRCKSLWRRVCSGVVCKLFLRNCPVCIGHTNSTRLDLVQVRGSSNSAAQYSSTLHAQQYTPAVHTYLSWPSQTGGWSSWCLQLCSCIALQAVHSTCAAQQHNTVSTTSSTAAGTTCSGQEQGPYHTLPAGNTVIRNIRRNANIGQPNLANMVSG